MGQRDTMNKEYFNGPMYDINQRQRAMSQNNQSRKTVQDPLYDDHSAFFPKAKPRNGTDLENLRVENYVDNHYQGYPVVNRQFDKSNVRNNPKAWSKNLQEEFIPNP